MKLIIIADIIVLLGCIALIIWTALSKDWWLVVINVINTMTWSVLLCRHLNNKL